MRMINLWLRSLSCRGGGWECEVELRRRFVGVDGKRMGKEVPFRV